jgi:GMP synthase-like glutamine amidotransferase
MHIGILKTDAVRPEWVPAFGEYPDMFERLVRGADSSARFTTWDVEAGIHPSEGEIDSVDGFIITGSKSSVYDDKSWIRDLEGLIQTLHAKRKKMVGICFGHQIIAKALGGLVSKSEKGWGVGINVYDLTDLPFEPADEAGMNKADPKRTADSGQTHILEPQTLEHKTLEPKTLEPKTLEHKTLEHKTLKLVASHQDQVEALPPGARTIATNAHCENAGFVMGDHIFTLQGHPEFIPDYAEVIMALRYDMIGAGRVAEGRASLEHHQHEGSRVAEWMVDFFNA